MNFDPELFQGGRTRVRMSRQEKRQGRRQFAQAREKHPLDLTSAQLRKLQEEDPTLQAVGEVAEEGASGTEKFYRDNGLILSSRKRGYG